MKWANYLAMLYGAEESDCLVNFVNYVRWPGEKFPKEWFAEAYSAKFENFMLPIPCEYDQVFHRIYGDYHVCHRGGTSHDYPYYEKQLTELREWVRRCAQTTKNDVNEEIFPVDWKSLLARENGQRKKVVLYTNDIGDFITYRELALDKLESVLQIFRKESKHILLWWMPQEEMGNALSLVDQSLAAQYGVILEQYKKAGWGVCDESNDKQRVAETCDAYYGAENTLSEKAWGQGKPVMIACGN